jgi:hypothetical protein
MYCMKFIMILCEFGWTVISVALACWVVKVITTATLHSTMHVLLIGFVNEVFLGRVQLIVHIGMFETNRVGEGLLVGLTDVASFRQKRKELFDEENSRRLGVERVGID